MQRDLDGDSGPHRVVRDALFLLDPGGVDLLYHDCRGRVRPAAQAAERAPPVPDVGLPVHGVPVRRGVGVVHGGRSCDADAVLFDGVCHRRCWTGGAKDMASDAGDPMKQQTSTRRVLSLILAFTASAAVWLIGG